MTKKLKSCPHCGSKEGYYFKDYGKSFLYVGLFGETREKEECVLVEDTIKPPVFAKCEVCRKRIRLDKIR